MFKFLIVMSVFLLAGHNATAIPITSGDGNETCSLATGGSCSVQTLDPAAEWVSDNPLGQGAQWISYADTGRPGTVTAPPGFVGTFSETFVASAGFVLDLQVWADNWVQVWLDGVSIFSTAENVMFQPGTQAIINLTLLTDGVHTLDIDAYQDGVLETPPGNPFGIMYSGTLTAVSEPATLVLVVGGLVGIWLGRKRLV